MVEGNEMELTEDNVSGSMKYIGDLEGGKEVVELIKKKSFRALKGVEDILEETAFEVVSNEVARNIGTVYGILPKTNDDVIPKLELYRDELGEYEEKSKSLLQEYIDLYVRNDRNVTVESFPIIFDILSRIENSDPDLHYVLEIITDLVMSQLGPEGEDTVEYDESGANRSMEMLQKMLEGTANEDEMDQLYVDITGKKYEEDISKVD